jgi:hypothetical protein
MRQRSQENRSSRKVQNPACAEGPRRSIEAIIAANGGKMLAKDTRQQMRLPENVFSELLKTQKDSIYARHYHLDRTGIVFELI